MRKKQTVGLGSVKLEWLREVERVRDGLSNISDRMFVICSKDVVREP